MGQQGCIRVEPENLVSLLDQERSATIPNPLAPL